MTVELITERPAAAKHAKLPSVTAEPVIAERLALPAGVVPFQPDWINIIAISAYHVLAIVAFLPSHFTWSGVIIALLGTHLCGLFGINICYHRLLTHRGFKCPKWLEHSMVVIAMSCLQDTPARWVAVHRRHHQHADEQPDPHSPLVNFLWGHIGWLIVKNPELNRLSIYDRYAKDILRDPFYVALERNFSLLLINLAQLPLFFGAGFAASWLLGHSASDASQFGLSIMLFGVFVRTVLVWHITWAVNSVTHLWGYRNYETDEDSRNNFLVGFISNGEGWHNNHHADPRSARHGHKWWEFDTTWLTIRLLEKLGLATDVVGPSPYVMAKAGQSIATHGDAGTPTS